MNDVLIKQSGENRERDSIGSKARAPEDAALKGIQILEQVSRSEVKSFANPSCWAEFSSQELG